MTIFEHYVPGKVLWTLHVLSLLFFLAEGGVWSLSSGLYACKAGTLLLEPHLRSISFNSKLKIYEFGLLLSLFLERRNLEF
jgi:hypothetical protein